MATIVKDKPEVEGTSDLEEHIEENEFGSDDDVESILEDDDEEEEAPVESGGVKAFASAFKTIVTRDLGTKQKDPILAEDKGVVEKIEEEKEDAKIRRKLAAHKKALRTAFHVEEPPVMEIPLEREYRRIATKGVVAVFNAVKTFRTPVEEVADDVDEEGEEVTAAQEEVPNTRNKGRDYGALTDGGKIRYGSEKHDCCRQCGWLNERVDTTSKSKFLKLLKRGTTEAAGPEKRGIPEEEEEETATTQRKKKFRKTRADLEQIDS
ncbi:hypothetical protein FOL47_009503 [Perkinsus chesapeaki]|uniref:Uncharacterized protein n=1 Tax=Perkinsus chesapeaki TaxID=330153 RepID=A0A7J6L7V4_PERCH|nr:hypothetical protein FOL47_009503 [Perkinsus chesapeaki]